MILRQKAVKQDSKHPLVGDCLGFRSSYHKMEKRCGTWCNFLVMVT